MQFGVVIPHFGRTAQPGAVEAVARAAEELGFDSAWASDHVIVPVGEEHVPAYYYEPFPVMAAAAAVTMRILVGVSVLVLPYRHPVTTAKALATLDQMSGGRIILGAGVGGLQPEFEALGADYRRRGAVSDEYLDVMRACWTQDPIDFDGRFVQIRQMRALPKPLQAPFPVWVGGTSAAAIQRAALHGDGWHPYAIGFERFAAGVEHYRAACHEAGREPGVVSLTRLVETMATAPARLFNLGRGTLEIGAPADIVCFDPTAEFVVDPNLFQSKGQNTPFGGLRLRGRVAATILGGRITYERGETFTRAAP